MNFFEYLYCRLYWWNTEKIKEKNTPVFYSIAGLSVFHTYTIVPLYSIIFVLIYKTYSLEEILTLSPFVIINIIVFIIDFIYFKNKQSVLYKRFKEISKQEKKRKDVFCIIYIVSIIIVNVLISNYLRSKNMA